MVDVNGNFIVDVLVVLVEGDYMVIVMVIDDVGNSVLVNVIGIIDIIVLILILDF